MQYTQAALSLLHILAKKKSRLGRHFDSFWVAFWDALRRIGLFLALAVAAQPNEPLLKL